MYVPDFLLPLTDPHGRGIVCPETISRLRGFLGGPQYHFDPLLSLWSLLLLSVIVVLVVVIVLVILLRKIELFHWEVFSAEPFLTWQWACPKYSNPTNPARNSVEWVRYCSFPKLIEYRMPGRARRLRSHSPRSCSTRRCRSRSLWESCCSPRPRGPTLPFPCCYPSSSSLTFASSSWRNDDLHTRRIINYRFIF